MDSRKSLSRQSLKLDRKQFALLTCRGDPKVCMVLKPSHSVRRSQVLKTVHGVISTDEREASRSVNVEESIFYLGRLPDSDIRCEDPLISGKHLELICTSELVEKELHISYEARDLSTNGTLLDGQLMKKGEKYIVNHLSVFKLPSTSKMKSMFTFELRFPEVHSSNQGILRNLYVCPKGEEKKEQIESEASKSFANSRYNSLNLRIINETQQHYQKNNITHQSLKHFKTGPKRIQSAKEDGLFNALKASLSALVGKITGKLARMLSDLGEIVDGHAEVEEALALERKNQEILAQIMKEMTLDMIPSKRKYWQKVVEKIDVNVTQM